MDKEELKLREKRADLQDGIAEKWFAVSQDKQRVDLMLTLRLTVRVQTQYFFQRDSR